MKAVRGVLEFLEGNGVKYVFGIPAGSVNAFYDQLLDFPGMTPIVTKHEGAASYMAASYAKYSKQLSVCIGSSGPGGTNLLTGAANAMREHLPILFLTGAVPVSTMGLNASQELDAQALFQPITKYSVTVLNPADLLSEVAKAAQIALSGVPGPVHVAMPIDVQMGNVEQLPIPELEIERHAPVDAELVKQVADQLMQKKTGFIFAGQGVRNSVAQVIELAELLDWPIVATPVAKGLFREDHPLFSGVFGFAGNEPTSLLVNEGDAETLLVLGSSLGETATSNYNAHLAKDRFVIQVDFDATVFNRKYPVDIPVHGDMSDSLSQLIEELKDRGLTGSETVKLVERDPETGREEEYNTKNVLLKLQELLPPSTRYTIDIGEFMAYVIHHMEVLEEDTFDINVHFGAMGSGLSAAIGSKLAEPDRPVVALTGDGCFFMHGMEILTAKEYNLPVLFVVMNNARLGMVYQGHTLQYKRSHPSFEQEPVNIAAMAEALNIPNFHVDALEDLSQNVMNALTGLNGPAILEVALVDNNIPPMGDRVKFLSSFGK
ncbi:thiamine pyrophosphate-binding protein [Planococcus sp. CP5-4]|uniref:thiamine pyrophosphate-binding protein n=1 Tax=unclassified Planococcus (in: firmicutes) TaxID=2662419 RepID=UPI001C25075A|nr:MULTISPECIES: thiamine pyrophosphate-binding protein [unclassified Planococcus (in: firmicutes)]MBU9675025.1 thiamine pyrophosphate-binding protein [Planococcus sp. CP5-4_YE]MBV0910375.1 thiamine pyrophosphate-binding protein [Planococcus sp. CP5-4_UN]MBW6063849.1 thiamine pyrophosphate-binding protein [Planococcus sp. CP5-4]